MNSNTSSQSAPNTSSLRVTACTTYMDDATPNSALACSGRPSANSSTPRDDIRPPRISQTAWPSPEHVAAGYDGLGDAVGGHEALFALSEVAPDFLQSAGELVRELSVVVQFHRVQYTLQTSGVRGHSFVVIL
eukprot:CAMPEP_0173328688 /NCGR_PEP_ID=MMETSP1144-20121109/2303_1 /TAXON_ID=483371 /ORGANISM="non described non described, Strain CCMP2298" /LENGTH=132 /DNA_ID=CAMNT_0014273223 /DNA_START=333 /DNA_END=728 /DNA_ORIENTATION=-